jgi:signal peptidase II
MKHYKIFAGVSVIWIILDQLTKWWVQSPRFQEWIFIENFFYFTFHQNSGIAFGLPVPIKIQIMLSVILMVILFYFAWAQNKIANKKNRFLNAFFFGIIIGGGTSNLLDRMISGSVVDFINLKPIPTFNIADIGITLGLTGLLLLEIQTKKQK